MATDRADVARYLSDQNSAGNLSDTLEGLNLTHMSDSSGSLSPLSVGRSPLMHDPPRPSGAAAVAASEVPTGLDHPLSQPRLDEGKPLLPSRPRAVLGKQDRCVPAPREWRPISPYRSPRLTSLLAGSRFQDRLLGRHGPAHGTH